MHEGVLAFDIERMRELCAPKGLDGPSTFRVRTNSERTYVGKAELPTEANRTALRHRRLREALGSILCRLLGIATPGVAVVLPGTDHPSSIRHAIFGSRLPEPGASTFDFMPASLAQFVENGDYLSTWATLDAWIENRQPAQGVFVRVGPRSFRALKINHAYAFQLPSDDHQAIPLVEHQANRLAAPPSTSAGLATLAARGGSRKVLY